MTNVLMLFVAKLTILLVLGAALATLLRRRSAATRHFVWALTLCSAVVLAIVANAAPSFPLAIPDWRPASAITHSSAPEIPLQAAAQLPPASAPAPRPELPARAVWSIEGIIAGLWVTGFAALLIWFTAGHAVVSRIARTAVPADNDWSALIDEARRRMGATRPVRVALSAAVAAPFTAGWLQPIVLLPSDASAWPVDRRRAALMHELAHIARRDTLIHSLAGLACAIYWFHPLAWVALGRLRRESEQATDDLVIGCGMIAPDYAAHLLDVAGAARGGAWLLAVGMACPSHLETRLRALLDETRLRSSVSRRRAAMAIAGVTLLLVPLAVARPELRAKESAPPATQHSALSTQHSTPNRRVVDASPGGTLVLDLQTGAGVEVIGRDEPRVEVSTDLRGPDAGKTLVDVAASGDEIRVTSKFARPLRTGSTSHEFAIHVPRRFNVRLHSAGGDLTVRDVDGTFEGSTGGGSIDLTRLHGRANLSTGGGDIKVTDSDLEGRVSTGGGTVRFTNVRGGLRGNDIGDLPNIAPVKTIAVAGAPVEAAPLHIVSDGPLQISKAGGAIDLQDAPHGAVISTGGGRITVGRAAGTVVAGTGGGLITIGPVAGSVRASTGAGDVDIHLARADGQAQTVDVTTGNGDVVVTLPPGFDGRFEIETAYTESHGPVRIDSTWSLENEPVTDWDARQGTPRRYVRAHGSTGSGRGLVRIHAVNGNVTLRRGN